MEPYWITNAVFLASFLVFPIFLICSLIRRARPARTVLLTIQKACLFYWVVALLAVILLPPMRILALPGDQPLDGSVFMLWPVVTPLLAIFVFVERTVLKRDRKREERARTQAIGRGAA